MPLTSLLSVSHRSQPHQQSSQPQRTLLQHVAQSQTATQTSVVVKSIPASSTGAITHIMQQVVPFLLQTVCKTAVGYVNDAGAGFLLNECVAVIGNAKCEGKRVTEFSVACFDGGGWWVKKEDLRVLKEIFTVTVEKSFPD